MGADGEVEEAGNKGKVKGKKKGKGKGKGRGKGKGADEDENEEDEEEGEEDDDGDNEEEGQFKSTAKIGKVEYSEAIEDFKGLCADKYMSPDETYDNFEYRRDGKLSMRELDPPMEKDAAKEVFKELDQDGNKGVTKEELWNALGGCESCKEEFAFKEDE